MKYVVNEGCIGCGLCVSTCPEVFEFGDDGLAFAKDIDTEDENAAIARDGCPVAVIEEL